jgi:hypothetical protein
VLPIKVAIGRKSWKAFASPLPNDGARARQLWAARSGVTPIHLSFEFGAPSSASATEYELQEQREKSLLRRELHQ